RRREVQRSRLERGRCCEPRAGHRRTAGPSRGHAAPRRLRRRPRRHRPTVGEGAGDPSLMASFADIRRDAPELGERAERVFDAHKHKTIATVRADGSPRISGIELDFLGDDVWFGSMPGSRKSADLKRDPRFAMHSTTADAELTDGDAKF